MAYAKRVHDMKFSVLTLRRSLPPLFPKDGGIKIIFPVNAQLVGLANKRPDFVHALETGHCVVDGQVLLWAANLRARLKGLPNFEKLSGSDLVYRISEELAAHNQRLLLVGASEASNSASVRILRERFGLDVHGYSPPFATYPMPRAWVDSLLDVVKEVRPDAIFVAFGAPKQELLIASLKPELQSIGISLVMAVGGSLDFLSGGISRAPLWVQSIGLEGLYRLIQEPNLIRLRRIVDSIAALRHFWK